MNIIQPIRKVYSFIIKFYRASILFTIRLLSIWLPLYRVKPLVEVFHLPRCFSRRKGYFTANICGRISPLAGTIQYRLNQGPWCPLRHHMHRIKRPLFTIELRDNDLKNSSNVLTIKANRWGRNHVEINDYPFEYDRSQIQIPLVRTWEKDDLDVVDGWWESFQTEGTWRVRLKPGYEGYDKILLVAGAFAGGRRVETDVIFHRHQKDKLGRPRDFGFGVLSLWGGHPDQFGLYLGRGWNFALAWYWALYSGVGNEFSYKYSSDPPNWVNSYRNLLLQPDVKYSVLVEVWPVRNAKDKHLCYRQRMKWWPADLEEPETWIELADINGSPLPVGEYGVAVMSLNCQVDYGQVIVSPLDAEKKQH